MHVLMPVTGLSPCDPARRHWQLPNRVRTHAADRAVGWAPAQTSVAQAGLDACRRHAASLTGAGSRSAGLRSSLRSPRRLFPPGCGNGAAWPAPASCASGLAKRIAACPIRSAETLSGVSPVSCATVTGSGGSPWSPSAVFPGLVRPAVRQVPGGRRSAGVAGGGIAGSSAVHHGPGG